MPNDQPPAFEPIGKHDDQARHHPIVLFAVAMRQEEPALLIHQQLVQPGFQLVRGQSELFATGRIASAMAVFQASLEAETSWDRARTYFAPSCRPASAFPFRRVRPDKQATSFFAAARFSGSLMAPSPSTSMPGSTTGRQPATQNFADLRRLSDRARQPLDGGGIVWAAFLRSSTSISTLCGYYSSLYCGGDLRTLLMTCADR